MTDDDHDDYTEAVDELAAALCRTWWACETTGANLPEALSYTLALAARELADDDEETADMLACGWKMDQDLATGLLVRHRPGSWEADHVVQLTYMLDLLPEPADRRPS